MLNTYRYTGELLHTLQREEVTRTDREIPSGHHNLIMDFESPFPPITGSAI